MIEERGHDPKWTVETRYTQLFGIAVGMSILSAADVVHRERKPENIMLDASDRPVIRDFGIAKTSDVDDVSDHTTGQGTLYYQAPELMENKPYSGKVDVYSFGILMNSLLFGRSNPYPNYKTTREFMKAMIGGVRPDVKKLPGKDPVNPKLIELMKKCWSADPHDRPAFSEIVQQMKAPEFYSGIVGTDKFQSYIEYLA